MPEKLAYQNQSARANQKTKIIIPNQQRRKISSLHQYILSDTEIKFKQNIKQSILVEFITINLLLFSTFDKQRGEQNNQKIGQFFQYIINNQSIIIMLLIKQLQENLDHNQIPCFQLIKKFFISNGYFYQFHNSKQYLVQNLEKIYKQIQQINYSYPELEQITNSQISEIKKNNPIQFSQIIEFFAKKVSEQKIIQIQNGPVGPFQHYTSNEIILDTKPPYLPQMDPKYNYTVVLDLDETLIHYFDKGQQGYYKCRPYLDQFLSEMAEMYELVIFTAGLTNYANWVVDQIDKDKKIKYRLYRQHCTQTAMASVKDLSKIGRDLKKTIIVDNVKENFLLQKSNGIEISTWFSDKKDTALKDLLVFFKELYGHKPIDIRKKTKQIRNIYFKYKHNFILPY